MKLFAQFLSNIAALWVSAAGFFACDDIGSFALELERDDQAREGARRQLLLERARIEWASGSRPAASLREGELQEVWL